MTKQKKKKSFSRDRRKARSKTQSPAFADPSLLAMMGLGTARPLAESEYEAMRTYLDAHLMLPFDFEGDKPAAYPLIQDAFAVLGDDSASPEALLRALVTLGHTPTTDALQVLRRHAASDRPHADVAKFAAEECVDWIAFANTSPAVLN